MQSDSEAIGVMKVEGPTIYLNSGFFVMFLVLIILSLVYPKQTEENKKNILRFKMNKILNLINLVLLNLFVNLILITIPIQRTLRNILKIEVSNPNDSIIIFQHMLETYESLSIIFIFAAIEVLIIFILLLIINRKIYKKV